MAGAVLIATAILPFDRRGASGVNLFDRAGSLRTLAVIRLALPAVVGMGFIYLGLFARFALGIKAAIAAGLLTLMVLVGVDMFEILRVARPPIAGKGGERLFGMRAGTYFPREDTLHLVLLGAGLCVLGASGRYRTKLQSSKLGSYGLMCGCALLLLYYVVPYKGMKVPAVRNVALTLDFTSYADKLAKAHEDLGKTLLNWPRAGHSKQGEAFKDYFQASKSEMYRRMMGGLVREQSQYEITVPEAVEVIERARKLRVTPVELATYAPAAPQIKVSAWYFTAIYLIPLMLALIAIGAFKPSRYHGHRALYAKAAQWGSIAYLLAFLLPMLAKEGMKSEAQAKMEQLATGEKWLGFWPNFRAYLLLAVFLSGFVITLSIAVRELIEPERTDAGLPANPLEWRDEMVPDPDAVPPPEEKGDAGAQGWDDDLFS